MCGRLRVGKGFLHVCSIGRCGHVGMDGPTSPACRLITRSGMRFEQRRWNMTIAVIGLDLAKNVFQVHGIDGNGRAVLRRKIRRSEVLPLFSRLPPARVGMEACHTSHYWAREIARFGHDVRMMPAQFVKPYVKSQRTTQPMPRRFARLYRDRRCDLCQSSPRINKPH